VGIKTAVIAISPAVTNQKSSDLNNEMIDSRIDHFTAKT